MFRETLFESELRAVAFYCLRIVWIGNEALQRKLESKARLVFLIDFILQDLRESTSEVVRKNNPNV